MKVNYVNYRTPTSCCFPQQCGIFCWEYFFFLKTIIYNPYQYNSNPVISCNIMWEKKPRSTSTCILFILAAIVTNIQLDNKHEDCQMLSAKQVIQKLSQRKRKRSAAKQSNILLQPLWLEHINLWQNSFLKSKRIESDHSRSSDPKSRKQ